jgi:hypothetical protein
MGGTVSINGHQVRSSHRKLPPIKAGTDALFFLTRNNDKLFIAMKYLGVFAIENDRIIPLTRTVGFAAQDRGRPAADFVRDVLALPTAVRPAK